MPPKSLAIKRCFILREPPPGGYSLDAAPKMCYDSSTTPAWRNGRHKGLKIPWAGCSTQSELCLQTTNFFDLIFLCVGTSLQHIPPTSYPSIGGIEYAAMVELVDTRDLKSRSGFQSTGSSPVSGTILLILRAVYCSENYFLGKIERIALAEDSLLFSSKWV